MWNNIKIVETYEEWIKEIDEYNVFLRRCLVLIRRFLNHEKDGDLIYVSNITNIKAIEVAVKEVIDNFPRKLIEQEWCFRENTSSIIKVLKKLQWILNIISKFLDQNSKYFTKYSSTNIDINDFFNYYRYRQCLIEQSKFLEERINAINNRIEDVSWCSSDSSDFDYSNNARFFSKGILIGILVAFCFLILLPAAIWHYIIKGRDNKR